MQSHTGQLLFKGHGRCRCGDRRIAKAEIQVTNGRPKQESDQKPKKKFHTDLPEDFNGKALSALQWPQAWLYVAPCGFYDPPVQEHSR